jgi:NADH-quinone oxidoreductase subunit N
VVATQLGAQAMVFYLAVYVAMNMAAFAVIVAREREIEAQAPQSPRPEDRVVGAQAHQVPGSGGRVVEAQAPQPPGPKDRVPKDLGGDSVRAMASLGRERPWLAWPMTIAMLALAGIPATTGFIGKFYLIDAAVSGGYTWLGVVIVIGSMISLGYYLPVVATMWMGSASTAATPRTKVPDAIPAIAGGSPELDDDLDGPTSNVATPVVATSKRSQPELAFVAILAGAATIFFGIVPQPLFNLVHGVGSALGLL